MSAFLFIMLSSTAASAAPVTPTPPATTVQQEAPVTKKVCQTIEVPMTRLPRRVCTTVVVKPPAPKELESGTMMPAPSTGENSGQ